MESVGVDFDELLKNVARQLAGWFIERRGSERAQEQENRETPVHARCYQRASSQFERLNYRFAAIEAYGLHRRMTPPAPHQRPTGNSEE